MIIQILILLALLIGVVVFQGIFIIVSQTRQMKNEDSNTNTFALRQTWPSIDTHMQDKMVRDRFTKQDSAPNLPLPTEIPAIREESPVYAIKDYWNDSNKTRPLLYIVTFGRLGNRLFHYAVTYCTALQTHRTPTIPKDSFLFELFPNLSAKKVNVTYVPLQMYNKYKPDLQNFDKLDKRLMVGETGWSRYRTDIHEKVNRYNNTWLKGCFQSWRYLVGCEKALRREFTFNPVLQEKVNMEMRRFADDYMKRNGIMFFHDITFVGIHVRLGDMTDPELQAKGYINAPPSYFDKAMGYYNQRYRWPLFIATSEDIKWCKDNINSSYDNVYYSNYTNRDYLLDFLMLSSCNHSIITVGSFGWFTGWLANGEVVYYDQFPVPGSNATKGFNATEKYPLTWIGMS